MTKGLDSLKRIVVLMMKNRSFDHMFGALMAENSRINGPAWAMFSLRDCAHSRLKV